MHKNNSRDNSKEGICQVVVGKNERMIAKQIVKLRNAPEQGNRIKVEIK